MTATITGLARRCLDATNIYDKLAASASAREAWLAGGAAVDRNTTAENITTAGLPANLQLVHPSKLSKRGLGSVDGRRALVHAIAHIEFNAINLAWDAVWRFRDMPDDYYSDWSRVAAEEASHFQMLRARLRELGTDYGDLPAHKGLWDMAVRTAHDPLVRMALVPRVLEARGLDVTPGMIKRLRQHGDDTTADILVIIHREEIGHVAIGTRWYHHMCKQRGVEQPDEHYLQLVRDYFNGELRGPFDIASRRQAGFSESELRGLGQL